MVKVSEDDHTKAKAEPKAQADFETTARRMTATAFRKLRLHDGVMAVTTCTPLACRQIACLLARNSR